MKAQWLDGTAGAPAHPGDLDAVREPRGAGLAGASASRAWKGPHTPRITRLDAPEADPLSSDVMDALFDVAVVGAGPAGSMAACGLARAGMSVALLDRATFPRDKVCGDALLPDAVQALEEAGLLEIVRKEALAVGSALFRSPGGHMLRVGGDFLTIRRERLDAMLVQAAVSSGACFLPGFAVTGPLEEEGEVRGVVGCMREAVRASGNTAEEGSGHAIAPRSGGAGRSVDRGHSPDSGAARKSPDENHVTDAWGSPAQVRLRARVVVLACGSHPRVLEPFGVLTRPIHSAIALRGYLPGDPFPGLSTSGPALFISYDRALLPGYGWAFPMPGGAWNVGCGVFLPESRLRGKPDAVAWLPTCGASSRCSWRGPAAIAAPGRIPFAPRAPARMRPPVPRVPVPMAPVPMAPAPMAPARWPPCRWSPCRWSPQRWSQYRCPPYGWPPAGRLQEERSQPG